MAARSYGSNRIFNWHLFPVHLDAKASIGSTGGSITAPSLGLATSMGVLAYSTVTNTGSTTINGDLGLFPGTSVTGAPTVTGTSFIADATAQQAQVDVAAAYNDLASRPYTTDLSGQDLGGMTLTPGVYRFSSSAQLTGTLTLNGGGDPTAVFIFQIGSTLTTASSAVVALSGSALSGNIFWVIGSSATIGTSTTMRGNMLAMASVTMTTSATLAGRALARNGAVTLDTNVITASAISGATSTVTLITSSTVPGSNPTATQRQSMGVKSITRLGVGTYRLQLDDNYSSLFDFRASFSSAPTGTAIAADATSADLIVGQAYQIVTVGTTTAANWTTLGLPFGMTPTVGQVFIALTTGTGAQAGAGTVKELTNAGANLQSQVLGDPDLMLNTQPYQNSTGGGYITFQTLGPSSDFGPFTPSGTVTAPIFTGENYTPLGTNSVPTFTGSALASHDHNLIVIGGQADSDVNDVAIYGSLDILGKEQAGNATVLGVDSATKGGVVAGSSGTPAGTVTAPTFTGTAHVLVGTNSVPTFTGTATPPSGAITWIPTDPTYGSTMYMTMLLSNSSIR